MNQSRGSQRYYLKVRRGSRTVDNKITFNWLVTVTSYTSRLFTEWKCDKYWETGWLLQNRTSVSLVITSMISRASQTAAAPQNRSTTLTTQQASSARLIWYVTDWTLHWRFNSTYNWSVFTILLSKTDRLTIHMSVSCWTSKRATYDVKHLLRETGHLLTTCECSRCCSCWAALIL